MEEVTVTSIEASIRKSEKKMFIRKVEYLLYLTNEISLTMDDLKYKMSKSESPILFYADYAELSKFYDMVASEFRKLKIESEKIPTEDTNFIRLEDWLIGLHRGLYPYSSKKMDDGEYFVAE